MLIGSGKVLIFRASYYKYFPFTLSRNSCECGGGFFLSEILIFLMFKDKLSDV